MPTLAPELMRAVNFAIAHEVICVASVGNHGLEPVTHPAALRSVLGIASVSPLGQRSVFTNYRRLAREGGRARRTVGYTVSGRPLRVVSGTSLDRYTAPNENLYSFHRTRAV